MTEQKIICGDNIEVLKGMADNSVDSICTDAPYGLGEEPDPMEVMKDWIEKGYHEIKCKGGFMGKAWDAFVPQPLFWKEAFRVLKPGGYVLSFFGTRTYDWGVMAMRFAGFEIRDLVEFIYGTGFPKSLSISKQIDKATGVDRKIIGGGRSGKSSLAYQSEETTTSGQYETTASMLDEAKQWDGWGTALKPAHEPIVLARKPISEKTVAANVLKHGTGGINIDACRVKREEGDRTEYGRDTVLDYPTISLSLGKFNKQTPYFPDAAGRFPSNLIFGCACETKDHEEGCPVKELNRQSGVSKSSKGNGVYGTYEQKSTNAIYSKGLNSATPNTAPYEDEGGASRFFYIAKPSDYEKQRGLRFFEDKDPASVTDFRPTLKSNPENWANGTETPYTRTTPKANNHSTVKPVSLMRYLVKMITAKGGTCLDPFNGSGTTGIACKLEGMNYIGIEQDEYHCKVSEARIAVWQNVEQNKLF